MRSGGSGECVDRLLGKVSQYIGHVACEDVPGCGQMKMKTCEFC